jgi:hypothetical protein
MSQDGAMDIIRAWYYKNAFSGLRVRYPEKDIRLPDGTIIPARDYARQITEWAKVNAGIALPNTKNQRTGEYEWSIEDPKFNGDATGILDYVKFLDSQITRGILIPDNVITESTGGGYSGRKVPEDAFYVMEQRIFHDLIETIVEQIVRPLVEFNWGLQAEFDVDIKPIIPIRQQAAQNVAGVLGKEKGGAPDNPAGEILGLANDEEEGEEPPDRLLPGEDTNIQRMSLGQLNLALGELSKEEEGEAKKAAKEKAVAYTNPHAQRAAIEKYPHAALMNDESAEGVKKHADTALKEISDMPHLRKLQKGRDLYENLKTRLGGENLTHPEIRDYRDSAARMNRSLRTEEPEARDLGRAAELTKVIVPGRKGMPATEDVTQKPTKEEPKEEPAREVTPEEREKEILAREENYARAYPTKQESYEPLKRIPVHKLTRNQFHALRQHDARAHGHPLPTKKQTRKEFHQQLNDARDVGDITPEEWEQLKVDYPSLKETPKEEAKAEEPIQKSPEEPKDPAAGKSPPRGKRFDASPLNEAGDEYLIRDKHKDPGHPDAVIMPSDRLDKYDALALAHDLNSAHKRGDEEHVQALIKKARGAGPKSEEPVREGPKAAPLAETDTGDVGPVSEGPRIEKEAPKTESRESEPPAREEPPAQPKAGPKKERKTPQQPGAQSDKSMRFQMEADKDHPGQYRVRDTHKDRIMSGPPHNAQEAAEHVDELNRIHHEHNNPRIAGVRFRQMGDERTRRAFGRNEKQLHDNALNDSNKIASIAPRMKDAISDKQAEAARGAVEKEAKKVEATYGKRFLMRALAFAIGMRAGYSLGHRHPIAATAGLIALNTFYRGGRRKMAKEGDWTPNGQTPEDDEKAAEEGQKIFHEAARAAAPGEVEAEPDIISDEDKQGILDLNKRGNVARTAGPAKRFPR